MTMRTQVNSDCTPAPKRHEYRTGELVEIRRWWTKNAREQCRRTAFAMENRIQDRIAIAPPHKSHWFFSAWCFVTSYNPKWSIRRYKNYDGWLNANWVDLVLRPYECTHHFSLDLYPIADNVTRHRSKWQRGQSDFGRLSDVIRNDRALTCDGMHLWMWCCVKHQPYHYDCRWYVERQLTQVLQLPVYQRKLPGVNARELMEELMLFHLRDCSDYDLEANEAKARQRAARRSRILQ